VDSTFLRKYLAADHVEVRKLALAKLQDIALQEGPLPPPAAAPIAQSAPATAQNAATGQSRGGPSGYPSDRSKRGDRSRHGVDSERAARCRSLAGNGADRLGLVGRPGTRGSALACGVLRRP